MVFHVGLLYVFLCLFLGYYFAHMIPAFLMITQVEGRTLTMRCSGLQSNGAVYLRNGQTALHCQSGTDTNSEPPLAFISIQTE